MNAFDFYILPVFNVDGYVYTWTKDRNWRKTRSKTKIPFCVGVDPNRNWDDHFCEGGASKDPCSDSYCGSHAFSEPEVKGVADYLAKHNDSIVCYINFHSYSQLWMSPFGWTKSLPNNYTLQVNLINFKLYNNNNTVLIVICKYVKIIYFFQIKLKSK